MNIVALARFAMALFSILFCDVAFAFFWPQHLPATAPTRTNRRETLLDEEGQHRDLSEYRKRIAITGRLLVTMMGYPQRCERRGQQHVCTLALSCWMAGGVSHDGCGTNPWFATCCVIPRMNVQPPMVPLSFVAPASTEARTKDECGVSADRVLAKRIIGGNEARFAQFPWQAHLKIFNFQCGGVLVSRKFVATAAHCIIRAKLKDITVYLGELDTQDTGKVVELAPAELHRVQRKIVHPAFEFRTTQPDRYDLALLQLVTPAGHSFHIAPICLPSSDLVLQDRQAVVAGWGKMQPSTSWTGTNVLRSAHVPILSKDQCFAWHKSKQIKIDLYDEMLCAGHEDGKQDACLGDSGGPLIILENGRWVLVGITSAGFGCGEYHQPGIYHSILVTAHWIQEIIWNGKEI